MGGVNTFSAITAPGFARVPDVEIIYAVLANQPSGWFFDRMQQLGFKLHWIPCFKPPDVGVLWRIRDFAKRHHIDVIQTNGYRGDFYARSMLELGLARLPTVIIKHGLPACRSSLNRLYSWVDKWPIRAATRVIAVDRFTFDSLGQVWKVSEERLKLVHNPAPSFVQPPDEVVKLLAHQLSLEKDIPLVLFLGRIEREKGIFELLQAHKNMYEDDKPFYLLIVGDGSIREDVMRFSLTIPSAQYLRWVGPQLDIVPYLALCNIFVLPSYSEGLPFSLLEAMSAEKPVIATHVGGIPDAVAHNVNGILIEPKQVNALVQAISFLLKNTDIASQMGVRGREIALCQFSLFSAVEEICEIYRDIVKEFRFVHHKVLNS